MTPNRRLHWVLFILFISGAGALAVRGWEFYSLSLGERVDHPDFRVLGPGSNLGHGYGIAGTALILTNLLYLVRRRFARLSMGSLKAWLDVHVFTGLFGGLLVLFHSAFQVRSVIAWVTMGSLIVVQVTGIVGRYLYTRSRASSVAGALFKSWRGVHRFSALLLVLVVSLHIGVAWYYGFAWVFGAES